MSDIPHLGFIVAAYLVAAATIVAMTGAILLDYRRLSRALDRLGASRQADAAK